MARSASVVGNTNWLRDYNRKKKKPLQLLRDYLKIKQEVD